MAELSERLPLAKETVDAIKARLTRDTVIGLDPADSSYPDLILGSILNDLYGTVSLEVDRVYDRVHTELPASVLPSTTTGDWLDDWADSIGLVRKDESRASGAVTFTVDASPDAAEVAIPLGAEVAAPAPAANADELGFTTTEAGTIPAGGGSVTLPVVAIEAGALSNVPANAVTILESDVSGEGNTFISRITNESPISGGADVEDDDSLRGRVLLKLAGAGGAGNVTDYVNWCLAEPGVGGVTVQPNWNGPGTVRCVIVTTAGDAAGPELIGRLQQRLDPVDGDGNPQGAGLGLAPIGATVTVATPETVAVSVAAGIRASPGYSIGGSGGTRRLDEEILRSVAAYFAQLETGQPVVLNKVLAAIVDVEGVEDAPTLTLDGLTQNRTVQPLQVATLALPIELEEA